MQRRPRQPHPGTRIRCDRCSLPGLTGLTSFRREGTGTVATSNTNRFRGLATAIERDKMREPLDAEESALGIRHSRQ